MDTIKNIFVKAVSGIILFIIYIFILVIALYLFKPNHPYDNGIFFIFCLCMTGVITPIWYFKHKYKKVSDYISSAILFVIMCLGLYAIEITEGFDLAGDTGDTTKYLLVLYAFANFIYLIIYKLTNKGDRYISFKRIISTAILYAIYILIMVSGIFTGTIIFIFGVAVIITLIFYFITTKYFKISYDMGGLIATIFIFMIINLIFCCLGASDIVWGLVFATVLSFLYASVGLTTFVIIFICRSIKGARSGEVYWQTAEDSSPDRAEEKDNTDNTDENGLTDRSEPQKNYNLQAVVLEDIKKFLMDSEKDFLLIDEGYHLNAGNDVYHPDLLFYHMKLQCNVAVYLKSDDLKPEYLDGMNVYLETLDRDIKKPHENPSMGIILCKNEGTEVVEYSLNKGLSQEMAAEYEAKLPDKKILQEKLGELYNRAKGNHSGSDT